MTFEFGQFQLDAPGRVLRLAEREISLQPRVFDLLVYLVQSRARVVANDELLDALWPGVTVTENSLQRAVSALRGALREGDMERTIRNFPGKGYRFCIENARDEIASATDDADAACDPATAARQAIAEQRWSDAITSYEKADAVDALTGDDLDQWALALQCLGRPSAAIPVLVRGIAAHTQAAHSEAAAASASALSMIHLECNQIAVAKGWLARAQDLTTANPESRAAAE